MMCCGSNARRFCRDQETEINLSQEADICIDPGGIDLSPKRKRFMSTETVEENHSPDALIVPRSKSTMSISVEQVDAGGCWAGLCRCFPWRRWASTASRCSPHQSPGLDSVSRKLSYETFEREAQNKQATPYRRPERIYTDVNVCELNAWWGTGPYSPDRRLEAAMPGHVLASEVIEVAVKKALDIEELRQELPLDDLCSEGGKYLLWQMRLGTVCLASLHHVVADATYDKVINAHGADLLRSALKLIVTPVNLKLSIPTKGPKDADTIAAFFGPNASFQHSKSHHKYDVAMISIDLYSVWSLKMLLPSVAFKPGRMVDFHLVSYVDNAALASYRAAMNPAVMEMIKNL